MITYAPPQLLGKPLSVIYFNNPVFGGFMRMEKITYRSRVGDLVALGLRVRRQDVEDFHVRPASLYRSRTPRAKLSRPPAR